MVVAVALVVMMAVLGAVVALVKPRVSTTCWAHTPWSLQTTDDYLGKCSISVSRLGSETVNALPLQPEGSLDITYELAEMAE